MEARAKSAYSPPHFPKIIHQSWKDAEKIPYTSADFMVSWMHRNSDHEYWFWSDLDNTRIWEHPSLLPYRSFAHELNAIQLADMSRYAYMYLFGGIYADIDFECKGSFGHLPTADIILSPEPQIHTSLFGGSEVSNAILVSTPKQKLWLKMLDNIIEWDLEECNGNPIGCTGPIQLYKTLQELQGPDWKTKKDILVLSEDYFFPEYSEQVKSVCKFEQFPLGKDAEAKKKVNTLCQWMRDYPNGHYTNNTIAVHHWACRWCGRTKDLSFDTLDSVMEPYSYVRPFLDTNSFSSYLLGVLGSYIFS
jgi:mannosyltransferase OCH1-like enzyme